MTARFGLRVYYEDTDLAGIVYYANYLRFLERGRTEALIALGIDQRQLRAEEGLVFAVRHVEIDYLAPAFLQDDLTVVTTTRTIGGSRVVLSQDVLRGSDMLVRATVTVVCIGADGRPRRVPEPVRTALATLNQEENI